jgi:hypothetical protein
MLQWKGNTEFCALPVSHVRVLHNYVLWQIYSAGNNTNVGIYVKCQILNSNKGYSFAHGFLQRYDLAEEM